ncbi:MAG: transglutaminase domain-containing protein [Bacteroidales bacterium]
MLRRICVLILLVSLFIPFSLDAKSARKKNNDISLEDLDEFANSLVEEVSNERRRLYRIFEWVSKNISYDCDFVETEGFLSKNDMLRDVLKTRKGICLQYSELIKALCDVVGIKTHVILGYIRDQEGAIQILTHAWNGVVVDSRYYILDATLAAGYLDNGGFVKQFDPSFFLMNPHDAIEKYMPFDPVWQFLDHPLYHADFILCNYHSREKSDPVFHFKDSILELEELSMHRALEISANRITRYGILNENTRDHISKCRFRISKLKYAEASAISGKATRLFQGYNKYIKDKNVDIKKEDALALMNRIIKSLDKSIRLLRQVKTKDKLLLSLVSKVKVEAKKIRREVKDQKIEIQKKSAG